MSSYDSNNRRSNRSRSDSSRSSRYSGDRSGSSNSSSRSRRSSSRSSYSRGGRITVSLRDEMDESYRSPRQTYESQQRSKRARTEERQSSRGRMDSRTEERQSGRRRTDSRADGRQDERARGRGTSSSRSGGSRGDSRRPHKVQTPRNAPPVQQGYGSQTLFAPQRPLVGRIVLVLGAILALVLVFFAVNTIGSCVAGGFHKVKWGITTSEDIHYDWRATDVAAF